MYSRLCGGYGGTDSKTEDYGPLDGETGNILKTIGGGGGGGGGRWWRDEQIAEDCEEGIGGTTNILTRWRDGQYT